MNQQFLQLTLSVAGNVITIVILDLAAAILGFVIAWLYARSVYTPVIKALEDDRKKLNDELSGLNKEVTGLRIKTEELQSRISGLEIELEKKNAEIKSLKEPAVKSGPLGKYVISQAKSGDYYFNLKATNGQVILTSKTFSSPEECRQGIESTRSACAEDTRFDRKLSVSNKPFFNLTNHDGQIIGKSEIYESEVNMEKGIASVKKNGLSHNVVEE